MICLLRAFVIALAFNAGAIAGPMKVIIIDGQNNHDWKATTPVLKKIVEDTGLFAVEVATAPRQKEQMSSFRPPFARYKVIVSNYNGEAWSRETQDDFVKFVRDGGGFVSVHAANNSFPAGTPWPGSTDFTFSFSAV